ncbi:tRNA lysidine(34) synthetase TilS [uncultured Limosilactobacillus sp.]|uniref:tRNA lysidine(34) synthetase TilS n=1 Tax=uncultured Limosilactobacillus sp. TaxID=2837629 RepID=UPI0025E3282D|nr:tRNA lysidine(34) synthetase TilS [uncultured Limosilactobacillus sp.]
MAERLQLTVKRCLTRYRFFSLNHPLIVAVSTGVDSMALLHVLKTLVPTKQIVVAHVNHHLRQQSQREEQFLRQVCRQWGIKLVVDQWRHHPDHGIEAAARQERYQFFARVMNQERAPYLLTAHHENDLAETMLMKLIRTGDVAEVVGLQESRPFADGKLIRPLLGTPKTSLIQYAKRHHIRWYEDETNHQDLTFRNRIRNHYLPELERENPRVVEHLRQFHNQLSELLVLKNELITQLLPKMIQDGQLNLIEYQKHSRVTRQWLLRSWLNSQQIFDLPQQQLQQIDHFLCNPQRPSSLIAVGEGRQLIKDYQQAKLKMVDNLSMKARKNGGFMVKFDRWYSEPYGQQWGIFAHPQSQTVAELWLMKNQLPLQVRPWQPADRIRLKSGNHQAVRRILIDQKVPLNQRQQRLVVVDQQGQVLWLIGQKTAWLDRAPVREQQYEKKYFCQK